jgi:DNA-binding transcriptional LysR family regulator
MPGALYDKSHHLLENLSEALAQARDAGRARSGLLRVTLPFRAWQVIVAPRLAAFQTAYPDITLDLAVEEGLTDIIAHGFHAGIRLGDFLQDDMIAVRLSRAEPAAYVAAPAYLGRHGAPRVTEDLLRHSCIRHRQISSGRIAEWRFAGPDGEVAVDVGGGLILNDLRSIVDAARLGFGIGWSLRRGVDDELEEGTLVQVLAQVTPPRPGFFLYFPRSLRDLGILRCFVDHFCEG